MMEEKEIVPSALKIADIYCMDKRCVCFSACDDDGIFLQIEKSGR